MRDRYPDVAYSVHDPPFPHGESVTFAGGTYMVTNNGKRISLLEAGRWPLDTIEVNTHIAKMRGGLAATGAIFGSAEYSSPRGVISWIPTVPALNNFAVKHFRGLDVAGVQAVQSDWGRDTPSPIYAERLGRRRMDMARGPWQHVHDMFIHWLGAASFHEKPYAAFAELCQRADDIGAAYPGYDEGAKSFASGLSEGFEDSTALIVSAMRRGVGVSQETVNFLLGQSLTEIAFRCPPEALEEASKIVVAHHLGQPIATLVEDSEDEYLYTVPWELDNSTDHYETIVDRLQQEPAHPLAYLADAA